MSYAAAGVDIDAADAAKRDMARLLEPRDPRILNGVGPFATLIDATFPEYRHPVIVFKTEEPGTKQKLAAAHGAYRSLCFDLVNHLVNDIVVMGALPVAVQDAIICGSLQPGAVTAMVAGLAEACRAQECSLTGGETSEQPGVLEPGTYVLAASVVGVVERKAVIDGSRIAPGDTVLALASNGVHTNGYSLVRRLLRDDPGPRREAPGEEHSAGRAAGSAPLLPAGAAPLPGQRQPARPRTHHRRRHRGQPEPRAAQRHSGRSRPVAHRGAGNLCRAARRRSASRRRNAARVQRRRRHARRGCGRQRRRGAVRRRRRRRGLLPGRPHRGGGPVRGRPRGLPRRPALAGSLMTAPGEFAGLRANAGAPQPERETGSALEPRLDPDGRSGPSGKVKPLAAPRELDEPRPDEAEHLRSSAPPASTSESLQSSLLRRIAAVVAAIPHGRVATYGQVAEQAGNRRAARQVAWALRAYAGSGLPWHRVIGAGGAIRLPRDGLQRQRALLLAEGVAVDSNGRLDLAAYQWRP